MTEAPLPPSERRSATRVLVVAASPVTRAGLAAVAVEGGLAVAGAFPRLPSTADAVTADVLLLDVDAENPLEPADLPIVALADELNAADGLARGARAILPRDAEPEEIVAAVMAAGAGLVALRSEDAPAILRPHPEMPESLTPRELEVLGLLAEGVGNKGIARRLGISEHTVKFHVGSILGKLGASSRTEAVTLGIRQGLIMV